MAAIPVRTVPDPVLRQKAKKVTGIDPSIRKLLINMLDTLEEANGVGLAAPQIGVPLRVVVIRLPEDEAEDIIEGTP